MRNEIVKYARELADYSVGFEPAIKEIYLFPADDEIRMIYVDPTTLPSEETPTPFYNPPDPQGGIPYPYIVAIILPEEKGLLQLPKDWGDWASAVLLYRSKDLAA